MARMIDGKAMNMVEAKIKELRKAKGLSQKTLSDRLETYAVYVCRGSISRIEDKRRTVSDIELYGFAKVLEVPMDSLFEEA